MKNKVVMLTGASGQLGRSFIKNIIDRKGKILAIDKSIRTLKDYIKKEKIDENNILPIQCNIVSEKSVKNAIEKGIKKFGKINYQINNAGVNVFTSWKNRKEKEIDFVTDVNLKGTLNCVKNFINYCNKYNIKGSIVNISSVYSISVPDLRIYVDLDRKNSEIYGATKSGINQLTKYFAVNARLDGADIRINAVAPGGILNLDSPQGEKFQKEYNKRVPLKRMARENEIIKPTLFLLSNDASYINGHILVIDGGMSAW